MYQELKKPLIPFLIIGIVSAVVISLALTSGNEVLVTLITSGVVIIVPLLMASYGVVLFASKGMLSNDRFHMKKTNLVIALIFSTIAELTGAALELVPNSVNFQILVGMLQLIGILLWLEGALFYLYSTNEVLEFSDKRLMIPLLVILSAIPYLIIQVIFFANSASLNALLLISIPLETSLTIILLAELITLWHYRRGYFLLPILATSIAVITLLFRVILWSNLSLAFATPELQILASIGYWLLGISLMFVNRAEDVVNSV